MEKVEKDIHIENSGAVISDSHIKAKQVAGRDIYNYTSEPPSFATANLSEYDEDHYIAPTITREALVQIQKQKLLLVQGGDSFDKGGFIRHLGFKLKETGDFKAKEISLNEDNDSLYHQINKGPGETIYLLDQLHPQHVDYDLERLQSLAISKSLYILMTTDMAMAVWKLNDVSDKIFSFIIPKGSLYEQDQLTACLEEGLKVKQSLIASSVLAQAKKKSIQSIATDLGSPENINLFVHRLINEDEMSADAFTALIKSTVDQSESVVSKWYMSLKSKQKLIALGAALLEGAYDDQFFSIINTLTEKMWKFSHESLQALDYCDLDFLSDYFRFENTGEGSYVLQSKYPAQKIDIIKNAWSMYRRHLLTIVPVFLETAELTLNTKSADWKNFGTRERRANLRFVIGQTISEIGLISTYSIENGLIELAAHPDIRLKRIAAKSLARWREFGEEERLFDLLESWLKEERPKKIIREYLSRQEGKPDTPGYNLRALSYLHASAIQALSYAANYDSPNQLNERIISMFLSLMEYRDEQVVSKALETAIPKLVHHHILQLKDALLESFMKHDDMADPIAEGLIMAYRDYPEDLKSTLDRWYSSCINTNSEQNQRKKFTHRDKVLVTVLKFYGRLDFSRNDLGIIKLDEVYQKLVWLSKNEGRPQVRKVVFETTAILLAFDWKKSESQIPSILNGADLKEMYPLVESLMQSFLYQRQRLKGSKHYFNWNNEHYPIWLDLYERPKTLLEERLMRWVEYDNHVLKQLATLTFLAIAERFELYELDVAVDMKEYLEQNSSSPTRSAVTETRQIGDQQVIYEISPLTKVRIFFLLLFESANSKTTLKSILLTLYKYRASKKAYRQHLILVFRKWGASDSSNLRKLSRRLRKLI